MPLPLEEVGVGAQWTVAKDQSFKVARLPKGTTVVMQARRADSTSTERLVCYSTPQREPSRPASRTALGEWMSSARTAATSMAGTAVPNSLLMVSTNMSATRA